MQPEQGYDVDQLAGALRKLQNNDPRGHHLVSATIAKLRELDDLASGRADGVDTVIKRFQEWQREQYLARERGHD